MLPKLKKTKIICKKGGIIPVKRMHWKQKQKVESFAKKARKKRRKERSFRAKKARAIPSSSSFCCVGRETHVFRPGAPSSLISESKRCQKRQAGQLGGTLDAQRTLYATPTFPPSEGPSEGGSRHGGDVKMMIVSLVISLNILSLNLASAGFEEEDYGRLLHISLFQFLF